MLWCVGLGGVEDHAVFSQEVAIDGEVGFVRVSEGGEGVCVWGWVWWAGVWGVVGRGNV